MSAGGLIGTVIATELAEALQKDGVIDSAEKYAFGPAVSEEDGHDDPFADPRRVFVIKASGHDVDVRPEALDTRQHHGKRGKKNKQNKDWHK